MCASDFSDKELDKLYNRVTELRYCQKEEPDESIFWKDIQHLLGDIKYAREQRKKK